MLMSLIINWFYTILQDRSYVFEDFCLQAKITWNFWEILWHKQGVVCCKLNKLCTYLCYFRLGLTLFFILLKLCMYSQIVYTVTLEIVWWKRPRTWNVLGNKSFNYLSNSQVSAVPCFWVICQRISHNSIEFCMETPCGPPIWRPAINENIWPQLFKQWIALSSG